MSAETANVANGSATKSRKNKFDSFLPNSKPSLKASVNFTLEVEVRTAADHEENRRKLRESAAS